MPIGIGSQLFGRETGRRELMGEGGFDVSIEELFGQVQTFGQVEDDLHFGARLADGFGYGGAQLCPVHRVLGDLEEGQQRFALPASRRRQNQVGEVALGLIVVSTWM